MASRDNKSVESREIAGHHCLIIGEGWPVVRDANGARDLVQEAMNHGASMIAVPVDLLDPAFFELRSGLAGEILQKLANYRLNLAVVGDISAHVATSDALRDFVVEANRGESFFFVASVEELSERLAPRRSTGS
jgi:hypothetical protein